MPNRIFNGDSIAELRSYAQLHFDKLDRIVENLRSDIVADEYVRKNATTQGVQQSIPNQTDIVFTPPPGYGWLLGRVGIVVVPAVSAGAAVSLYVDYVSLSSLVEFISSFTTATGPVNGSYYADSFSNHIYVPDGGSLLVEWTGMPASNNMGVSLQGKLVRSGAPTKHPGSKFFGDA